MPVAQGNPMGIISVGRHLRVASWRDAKHGWGWHVLSAIEHHCSSMAWRMAWMRKPM
jgi:hypothetical protein